MQKKPLLTIITSMLMCSTAAYASNNTLVEQLNQNEILAGIQLSTAKISYDFSSNFNNVTGDYDVDTTKLSIGAFWGFTNNITLNAILPVNNDIDRDYSFSNGNSLSYSKSGQGDLELGVRYRLSPQKNYTQVYLDTKLATASSKSDAPGTGAIDYTFGARYFYEHNQHIFKNHRQYIDINYTFKGHKKSTYKGGDIISINYKSVGTGTGPRLVTNARIATRFSETEDKTKSSSMTMGMIGIGVNAEAEKNLEFEASINLGFGGDFNLTDIATNKKFNHNQNGLIRGFEVTAVKKF